jgi:hypothetical protein
LEARGSALLLQQRHRHRQDRAQATGDCDYVSDVSTAAFCRGNGNAAGAVPAALPPVHPRHSLLRRRHDAALAAAAAEQGAPSTAAAASAQNAARATRNPSVRDWLHLVVALGAAGIGTALALGVIVRLGGPLVIVVLAGWLLFFSLTMLSVRVSRRWGLPDAILRALRRFAAQRGMRFSIERGGRRDEAAMLASFRPSVRLLLAFNSHAGMRMA